MNNLPTVLDYFVPSSDLANRAFVLAVQYNHPVYDCLYLALAERESFTLVMDDAKLVTVAKRAKLAGLVQAL